MSMNFTGEIIRIDGRERYGTVVVETEVSDASFDHEFGTVHQTDIDHEAVEFIVGGVTYYGGRALDAWLTANLDRVEKRFDKECRR